jgi:hypothetical protein
MRRWLARARGSVRLRVTLLAAGLFAVTLGLAAFGLLRALEDDLVDDVRSSDIAELRAEAARVAVQGVPPGAIPVPTQGGAAFALPDTVGQQRIMLFTRDGDVVTRSSAPATTAEAGATFDVTYAGSLPMAQARVLGIHGDINDYSVSSVIAGDYTLATAP